MCFACAYTYKCRVNLTCAYMIITRLLHKASCFILHTLTPPLDNWFWQLQGSPFGGFLAFKKIFYVYLCSCINYVTWMLVPMEVRRGRGIPRSWSYKQMWASKEALGTVALASLQRQWQFRTTGPSLPFLGSCVYFSSSLLTNIMKIQYLCIYKP